MISTTLWILIAIQIAMGAFDTLFHHELTERLAWRPSQRHELRLHGVRNVFYGLLFIVLGWFEADGLWAMLVIVILCAELVITLMDFVEEDSSRKLPATERINHTLLALNYGAILALLLPVLFDWAGKATALASANHGPWSVTASAAAAAVFVFGLRDLAAAARTERLDGKPAGALVTTLAQHQTVLVTGATGFIGSRLVDALSAGGHTPIVLVRDPGKLAKFRGPLAFVTDLGQIPPNTKIDALVHLAGEPIAGGLWTKARKRAVIDSRVGMTSEIGELIARLNHRPSVFIAASAVGWYGLHEDEPLTEAAMPKASFSHESCETCERAASKLARFGVRVVALRIGLVLGTEGGLLARLLLPFEFGLGGAIGSGRQWMSWIARDDLVRLIAHVIATPALEGPVNATAPAPVRNAEFSAELARALRRPCLMRIPALPLRLLGGEMAMELMLGGQFVMPHKALASGFSFRHTEVRGALEAVLGVEAKHRPKFKFDAAKRMKTT